MWRNHAAASGTVEAHAMHSVAIMKMAELGAIIVVAANMAAIIARMAVSSSTRDDSLKRTRRWFGDDK